MSIIPGNIFISTVEYLTEGKTRAGLKDGVILTAQFDSDMETTTAALTVGRRRCQRGSSGLKDALVIVVAYYRHREPVQAGMLLFLTMITIIGLAYPTIRQRTTIATWRDFT